MGGNISAGFPGGLEIARNLGAKVWISAHDGDKDTTGFANNKITIQKYPREEIESVVSPRSDKFTRRRTTGTEAVILEVGEEMTLTRMMECGSDDDTDDTATSLMNLNAGVKRARSVIGINGIGNETDWI